MIDASLRRWSAPPVELVARLARRVGLAPAALTSAGLMLGLGAAAAAGSTRWTLALVLWIASRIADGLDGAVARLGTPSPLGGFLDIVADFTVYGAFVVGVAVGVPDARLAAVVLLCTYYVSGAAFLAWSSLVHQRARQRLVHDDDRSIRFVGGLAEGFETIVAYVAICIWPGEAAVICWVFAAMVAFTAGQRVWFAARDLAER
ncbi:MAG: CDP-alcohol phosphatidyltransferase family protein [Ilumatobacteraceae bacterium]